MNTPPPELQPEPVAGEGGALSHARALIANPPSDGRVWFHVDALRQLIDEASAPATCAAKDARYTAGRETTAQLFAAAELDSDIASVFADGTSWDDADRALIAIKGRQNVLRVRDLLASRGMLTVGKPVVDAARTAPQAQREDAADAFLAEVAAELKRARAKFPGDRIMTIALAEEFGELCKAVLDESAENVRKEAVQTAVMACRVAIDGDGSVRDWRAQKGLDQIGDDTRVAPEVKAEPVGTVRDLLREGLDLAINGDADQDATWSSWMRDVRIALAAPASNDVLALVAAWMAVVREIGLAANCLYSTFPDANDHIVRAVKRLAEDAARWRTVIASLLQLHIEDEHGRALHQDALTAWVDAARKAQD